MGVISRIAVMEGALDEVSLVDLLQVISISRQCTVVELRRPDQSPAGTLFIKAGKLIGAASPGARGREAFFRLVPDCGAITFHVFRTEPPRSLPEPIGLLGKLLIEALERGAHALPSVDAAHDDGVTSDLVEVRPQLEQAGERGSSRPQRVSATPIEQKPATVRPDGEPLPYSAPISPISPQHASVVVASVRDASSQRASVAVAPIRDASSHRARVAVPPIDDVSSQRGPVAVPATQDESSHRRQAAVPPVRDASSPRGPVAVAPTRDASSQRPVSPRSLEVQPIGSERGAQRHAAEPAAARAPQASRVGQKRQPQRAVSGEVEVSQTPPFVVALASPKGGSGKTTIALNLAVTLARQNRRVVLLDADINGDIASAIDARSRARYGAFDVLAGEAPVEQALLDTVMPDFKIMPATGAAPIDPSLLSGDTSEQWRRLLGEVAARTDIVLVDTPAGMLGPTSSVLHGVGHVLGVLQAELIAYRSFSMFARGLENLQYGARPRVLGVVLNMVQPAALASVTVLQQACVHLPREWLLETSIPRSNVFLDASEAGLPLRLLDDERPPALSFLFETLASELCARLEMTQPVRRPQRLLAGA